MDAHFPETVMMALKDAVVKVFWKKPDMRKHLERCGVPAKLIAGQDWERYKFHIINPIIDQLNRSAEGLAPLRRSLQETLTFKKCDHLLWLPDGKVKKREAEESVQRLQDLVTERDLEVKKADLDRKARLEKLAERQRGALFKTKLGDLHQRFLTLSVSPNAQAKGFALEDVLYDLFSLFELNPKSSFRRTGEQIDGAFSLQGDHFLLEAKWQRDLIELHELRDLDGAVGSSLDNTLGLFISINGFSPRAIEGYGQGSRPKLICMNGQDLMIVFESRIELPDLIQRKKDVAVQRRLVFVSATDILQGRY